MGQTTDGLLPTDGIVPLSHTLDMPGPMAGTTEDAALTLDALLGRNPVDVDAEWRRKQGRYGELRRGVAGPRFDAIGPKERDGVDRNVLDAFDRAADTLRQLGAEVVELDRLRPFDEVKDATFRIVTPEGYFHHGQLFEDLSAPLDENVSGRILPGRYIPAQEYICQPTQDNCQPTQIAASSVPQR